MLDVILTIVMFVTGAGIISHNDRKVKRQGLEDLKEWTNTDRKLEYQLFLIAAGRKTYADGKPINPHIKYWCETLWVINKQLEEKGLRLTPPWRETFSKYHYDDNGLCSLNPHYNKH